MTAQPGARLAVDIGGTFTDVAVEHGGTLDTAKTLTTPGDLVAGVMRGIALALERAVLAPVDVATIVLGTTLATNALIERKGATVGVITTAGFRDILEIAYERRYDQYDLAIEKPDTIVGREHCLVVDERMAADGHVLVPLDEASVDAVIDRLGELAVESVAVCLLHAYANPAHERRVGERLAARAPEVSVTLSHEVCPEAREYDRLCTALANAYIKPLMAGYLGTLEQTLRVEGFACQLYVITSGGGMTVLETAMAFPIRLVESGPSGGAILAAEVATACGLPRIVSFDMGGTTAKIALIEDGQPQTSRQFEVSRAARFIKGSGLPVRIPVIEMIEIGAGGGSVASVDGIGRLFVGPESAGAEPGPSCYARGGTDATVTDSDAVVGYLDPDAFAEGQLDLDVTLARDAIADAVATPLGVTVEAAADGISRMVDENMANAARVHAVERGKSLESCAMVAFGGNGPLHATRVAEKVGVRTIVVPPNPGVGSAIGFLAAPVAYEIVRSLYMRLGAFDLAAVNAMLAETDAEATAVVARGAGSAPIAVQRTAFMRYRGQGHEIEVRLAPGILDRAGLDALVGAYEAAYAALFGRTVPEMEIEVMNWSVVASTERHRPAAVGEAPPAHRAEPAGERLVGAAAVPWYARSELAPGAVIAGPALIVEPQTTTWVSRSFDARVDAAGNIVMTWREVQRE